MKFIKILCSSGVATVKRAQSRKNYFPRKCQNKEKVLCTKKFSEKRRKREMQQQKCIFLHCDCADFRSGSGRAFGCSGEKLSRKIYSRCEKWKIHFSLFRAIYRRHNFNYGCRMREKMLMSLICVETFYSLWYFHSNEKLFSIKHLIDCKKKKFSCYVNENMMNCFRVICCGVEPNEVFFVAMLQFSSEFDHVMMMLNGTYSQLEVVLLQAWRVRKENKNL